jgi:uncharacterized hydrophobic protein (TIGR00271 family)
MADEVVEPHGSLGSLLHGGRVGRADLEVLAAKLFFDREGTRDPYVRFGVLLLLSVVIATGGVITDSTATVIGAMIVAPLMTPIMATALAVVTADVRRMARSMAIVAAGVGAAVGVSYLMALISPVVVEAATNSQVSGRISPTTLDLVVALASGAAGAFALSRENVSDALPGVAIAISLVPPLCVVGTMLASGDPSAAWGAFLLFLTNFVAILVAGGSLLAVMGYGRVALAGRTSRARRRAAAAIVVATLVILVPLEATSAKIAGDTSLQYTVSRQATTFIAPTGASLAQVKVDGGTVAVVLQPGPSTSRSVAQSLADELHRLHPDDTVSVELVNSTIVVIPAVR